MSSVVSLKLVPTTDLLSVKELAAKYGVSKSTVYELIKSNPTFPVKNVGLKKKFMIDPVAFEKWIGLRSEQQREDQFGLLSSAQLLEKYKR